MTIFSWQPESSVLRYALILLPILGAGPAAGQDFQIQELSADGCSVVEHGSVTGDDRGGIAVSSTHVFYTGDSATGRFDLEDLSGGADVGGRYDALVSDLATGVVYSLGDGDTPISSRWATVTALLEIDGRTGALTGASIPLSIPIPVTEPTGIFAGLGRLVLHTGGAVYDVALPSGTVTELGAMAAPSFRSCESWAYWGVAEHFGGSLYLVYREGSGESIVRTRVPDGLTTTLAAFSHLSDMCSLTVSPGRGRWYFHHEFGSQFGGGVETLGSCQAASAQDESADVVLNQTDSSDPVAVGTSFLYTLTVTNDGPDDATAVRVTDRLPATVELVSAAASQGSCSRVCEAVLCELGDLPAGAGAAVTLEVIPRLPGTRINGATAFGEQIDPDPSNNEALESTEVDPDGSSPSLLSISYRLRQIDPGSGATLASLDLMLPDADVNKGTGLATHPATGELWALLELAGQGGSELVTLDTATGTASRVGNTGDRFAGLAFDDAGTLYGITGRWAAMPEALFVLDPTDATPSFVLSLADGEFGEAIAFAPDGLLYHASGADTFEAIDLDGPTVTDVGTCGDTIEEAHALAYLGGEILLLAAYWHPQLLSITTEGRRTVLGSLDHYPEGIAFADLPLADLALTQSGSADPVTAGETLTYTLTVTNGGPDEYRGVTVLDELPGTVGLVSAVPSQGACAVRPCGGLACSLGALAAGASATVTIEVTPLTAGVITNTAAAPALNDPDPGNNEAALVTTVLPGTAEKSLLAIDARWDQLRVVEPGSGATLASVTVTLAGETVEGGTSLATHPATGELWALLRLSGQAGRELVTLDPLTGVASRVGDTGDNFTGLAFDAGATLYGITDRRADTSESLFVLSQTDATPSFVLSLANGYGGEAIAFHPADGLLYHASDSLLGNFTLESIDLSGPAVTPIATCTWSGYLPVGAMTALGRGALLLAAVHPEFPSTSFYGLTPDGGLAAIAYPHFAVGGLTFVDLPVADLALTLSDSPDPVALGENLTYTLTVTNEGPDDFPDLRVLQDLPGAARLVSTVASQGTCDAQACNGFACSLGALEAGASATVTIEVTTLAAGEVTYTAFVRNIADPDPADNEVIQVTTVLPGAVTPTLLSIDRGRARLQVVDPTSAATLASRDVTLAGETVYGGEGLAVHPATGELWALLGLAGQVGRELVTLDPATGVATSVGDTGHRFTGLAFDAGGTLYGITSGALHVLSQTDATPSFVLFLAFDVDGEAIAYNPADGLLYHAAGYTVFESIDLSGPTAAPIGFCEDFYGPATALTYLDLDVLLLAKGHTLYGLTTAGDLTRVGVLDHYSQGLAFTTRCIPGENRLCLPAGSRRFAASVRYETVQAGGRAGEARAVPLDVLGVDRGGIFYFVNHNNPEFLFKVLDGCTVNERFWVFYAATTNIGFELTVTDTLAGEVRTYSNPDLHPALPIQDTQAFATCDLGSFASVRQSGDPASLLAGSDGGATARGGPALDPSLVRLMHQLDGLVPSPADAQLPAGTLAGECHPDATTLCLPNHSRRFAASVHFETVQAGGREGEARAIPLDVLGIDRGGIFYFIDGDNPEFLVKVLDGCAVNDHYWLFYAATTNVGFELTVTDTLAGPARTYSNPDLNPAAPVLDTRAFATCDSW